MTTKVVKVLKYVGFFSIVFFTIISCEKEIESIGVNLIDNNNFTSADSTFEVITENENVESVISSGVSQYLLGIYSDTDFGKLKASIVSQLSLPVTGDSYSYGENPVIDSVIVKIPYQSTKEDDESDGKPKFSIDSVFGKPDVEFKLSIYELTTFLNTLDPEDPSKPAIYYSDKEFSKDDSPLYSGNFKVNPSDTVSYIKRYLADGETIFDRDTIKQSDLSPSINIPLDETLIKELFIDNVNGIDFSSVDAFQHSFRGLYIEAEDVLGNSASHLLSLSLANANMTIYYSNDEEEGVDQDLNGNGIKDEGIVRIKQKYIFSFGSVKSNILERDENMPKASGDDKLYVQGAAGSIATIDLFSAEDIENIKNEVSFGDYGWLITNANLIFYVDQDASSTQGVSSTIVPEQLFLYNFEDNEQILDMMTEGIAAVGGVLERDEEGEPYRYVFKITDYISELLKKLDIGEEASVDLVKLGLKVYNPSDLPTTVSDTKIRDYSWSPKGVVLFGHDSSAGEKRVKLEISYTSVELGN
tara:strand:- start:2164 stop:3750 length:1587 start_codon:yes stop_codon:yes gene_type:complete